MPEQAIEPVEENIEEGVGDPDLGDGNLELGDQEGGEEQKIEGDKEPITFDERQQGVFDTEMGKKTAKIRETERENIALKQQIADAQDKAPKTERPVVPELPNVLDDDFQEKMDVRDKALTDAATFDANEKKQSEVDLEGQKAMVKRQGEALVAAVGDYHGRGEKLGITKQALEAAGDIVGEGLSLQMQAHLLDEPKGPEIIMYLSKHPAEADKLRGMSPLQGAVFIANEIAAKATKSSRKATKVDDLPEDPDENLNGKGSQAGKRGPPGAIYT